MVKSWDSICSHESHYFPINVNMFPCISFLFPHTSQCHQTDSDIVPFKAPFFPRKYHCFVVNPYSIIFHTSQHIFPYIPIFSTKSPHFGGVFTRVLPVHQPCVKLRGEVAADLWSRGRESKHGSKRRKCWAGRSLGRAAFKQWVNILGKL